MRFKIIALLLVFTLVFTCFAACGDNSSSSAPGTDMSGDSSAVDTEVTPSPTTYTTFDYEGAYATHTPETVVMTVNGHDITWEEYFGWIYTIVSQLESYIGTSIVWSDAFSDEYTFQSYTEYYAEAMTSQYSIIYNMAAEKGLELTAEEQQIIEDAFYADAETYAGGDIDAFADYLKSTFMSEEYYYYINSVATYYLKLFEAEYGEDGENFADEDVYEFIDTNGYLYAKHILFKTVDDAGTALEESVVAEKYAAAEDVIAQLNAISDQDERLAKFDELMNSLTEDPGIASYPNGYYFLPGEMVVSFEDGTKALEPYGISGIIESDYGYHIILRLPITPDDLYDGNYSFRYLAATYAFDAMASEWFTSAEIVYNEEFENLDFNELLKVIEITV